jgi:hypothetical protein
MYKYKSKNDTVKLNSALKTHTLTVDWNKEMSYIMFSDWDRGIFLVDLKLQSNDLHCCRTQKNVMDPWHAPYQNSNDY